MSHEMVRYKIIGIITIPLITSRYSPTSTYKSPPRNNHKTRV